MRCPLWGSLVWWEVLREHKRVRRGVSDGSAGKGGNVSPGNRSTSHGGYPTGLDTHRGERRTLSITLSDEWKTHEKEIDSA